MLIKTGLLWAQFALYSILSANLAPLWSYTGIDFASPEIAAVLTAGLLLAVVALSLPAAIRVPSDAVQWITASLLVVPTLAVACVNPAFTAETRTTASIAVLLGFATLRAMLSRPARPLPIRPDIISKSAVSSVILVVGLLLVALAVLGFGFSGFDLSFETVYERRLELRGVTGPFPGAEYLYSWLRFPGIPILLALGIAWKKWSLLLTGLLAAAVTFSIGGEKIVVFTSALVVLMFAAFRLGARGSNKPWFGMVLTATLAIPMLVKALDQSSNLDYLVTRRLGLGPGISMNDYVAYASENGYTYFAQNLAKFFAPEDGQLPLGYVIGDLLSPGSGQNANGGIWADGYVSLGFAGVVLVSVVLALIVRLADSLALSRDTAVTSTILAATFFAIVNISLFTALLTGGIVAAIGAVWVLPDPRNKKATGEFDPVGVQDEAAVRATD